MARGFSDISQPFNRVNTYGQNQNCYYCTVAALNDMTTSQLVNRTEQMMQDTAQVDEIAQLFRDAGNDDVQVQEFHTADTARDWVMLNIPVGQAVGLAFTRADASGHMVVLRRMFDSLECLDYQAAFVEMDRAPRYQPFPPEAHLIRFYVFNRA